jgi:hypothetical protein
MIASFQILCANTNLVIVRRVPSVSLMPALPAVMAVPTMHEEMQQRAQQQQHIGEQAENVCRMLGEQIKGGDSQEPKQDQTWPRLKELTS